MFWKWIIWNHLTQKTRLLYRRCSNEAKLARVTRTFLKNRFKMYMFGVVGGTHFHFITAKIYNILRYVIARILRHMCNLHINETEISQKRSKRIKNWKITYSVILSVLSLDFRVQFSFNKRSVLFSQCWNRNRNMFKSWGTADIRNMRSNVSSKGHSERSKSWVSSVSTDQYRGKHLHVWEILHKYREAGVD